MKRLGRLAWCSLCALLLSCSGGDAEAPPLAGGTQIAEATLMPDVRVLSDLEIAQIDENSRTTLTINGPLSLPMGTVFIAGDTAYKVIRTEITAGKLVLTVQDPALEDVFSKIDIAGNYDVTSDNETENPREISLAPAPGAQPRQAAKYVTSVLEASATLDEGAFSGSSKNTATLGLSVDFHYDRAAGGLRSASVKLRSDIQTKLAFKFKKGVTPEKLFTIKSYFIPISLTVYDRLLNLLGARVAGIYIPVGVVVKGEAAFEAGVSITSTMKGTASAVFDQGAGTTTSSAQGMVTMEVPTVSSDASATVTAGLGVYFNVRPALAALRSVALAGLDLRAGPRGAVSARAAPGRAPPYCLSLSAFSHAEAGAYFKSIGLSYASQAKVLEKQVFDKPHMGSCLAATTVDIAAVRGETSPFSFGDQITVDVQVRPVAGTSLFGKIPTGKVTLKLGNGQCTTIIETSGAGRCALAAGAVGQGVPLQAEYSGDVNYEGAQAFVLANIEKAASLATLSYSPNPGIPGLPVTLLSVLGPKPDRGQRPLPGGTVDFTSGAGTTLCSAMADSAGTATCTMNFSGIEVVQVTANYGGDQFYRAAKSVPVSVGTDVPLNTIVMTRWKCSVAPGGNYLVELDGIAKTNIVLVASDAFLTAFGESENSTAINAITTCAAWPGRVSHGEGGYDCAYSNGDAGVTSVHSTNMSTKAGLQTAWFRLNYYDPAVRPEGFTVLSEHEFPIVCPGAGPAL